MTARTVKGHMLVSILVPFTVTVDHDGDEFGQPFEVTEWIDDYNEDRSPDALEGAHMPWADPYEHEVYEAVIHDAEPVAESGGIGEGSDA